MVGERMEKTKMKKGLLGIIFDSFNVLIMVVLACVTIYPFLRILAVSVSSPYALDAFPMSLIPRGFTLSSYLQAINYKPVQTGLANSIGITVVCTFLNVLLTMMAAYSLSKKRFPHQKIITFLIVFTMFFDPGLVPNYMNIKNMGMINTYAVLILPSLINTYFLIICRSFFWSISPEIEESAKVDGANDLIIFFKLIFPISTPIFVTLLLWYGVRRWNAYLDGMIYITDPNKYILSVVLRNMINQQASAKTHENVMTSLDIIRNNAIIISTIPIIMIYPFIQKYFVKGIMLGSVKG